MFRQYCNIAGGSFALLIFLLPVNGHALEEIVVTARKKAENLQEIPLAITAFDSDTIKRKGINNLDALAKNTAGIVFDQGITSQDTRVVIRGLSPTRGRQNIAFLQDNIDISSEAISTAGGSLLVNPRYLDFERIEVVKGPQSALYGRAAFNGAINYITRDPGDVFEFEILADINDASGSENSESSITISGGGPITDTFGLRASATYWDEDGYYDNRFTKSENLGGGDGYGVSLKGLWQASDKVTVEGRISYSDDRYEQRPAAFLEYNALSFLPEEALIPMWVTKEYLGEIGNMEQEVDFKFYRFEVCGPNYELDGSGMLNAATAASDCAMEADINPRVDKTAATGERVASSLFGAPVASYRGQIPETDDLDVRLSPNPKTIDPLGMELPEDYPGTNIEVTRANLEVVWERENGDFTFWTGITDADQDVLIDFDKFAEDPDGLHAAPIQSAPGPGPDGMLGTADDIPCALSGGDCSWGTQQIDFNTKTEQFSQEIRYSSDLDGSWNYTIGGMAWYEETEQKEFSTTARASDGAFPFVGTIPAMGATRPNCYSPDAGPLPGVAMQHFMTDWEHLLKPGESFLRDTFLQGPAGVRDPDDFNMLCVPSGSDILQYLDHRMMILPRTQRAETKHWSLYAMFDFDLSETWKLSFEGRYTNEREEQTQPILDPADPEFAIRQSPSSIQPNCGFDPASVMPDDEVCGPPIPSDVGEGGIWRTPFTLDKTVATRTSFFTPRATLEWRPADDQMYYLSYAVGKKPGGFSRLTSGSGGFEPRESIFHEETLKVYELGAKTTLLDNTLQLNTALYYQDFEDKQVPTTQINFKTGLSTAAVENAAGAEIWGFELEANWTPTDRLTFGVGYNYLDTEYTDFKIKSSSANDLTRNSAEPYYSEAETPENADYGRGQYWIGNSCPIGKIAARSSKDGQADPDAPSPADVIPELRCEIDLTGNKLEDVPRHSLNLNARYMAPFGDTGMEWYIEAESIHQSQRFLEQANDQWLDSYVQYDVRAGIEADNWTAIFYVENFLDDETVRSAQTGPGISTGLFINGPPRVRNQVIAYPAPPRVVGVRFEYRMGGS
ncbi:MAG: TonB-dependent receptor [Gammaproteobacteria bacterium]|jgi:outer membrane receptor protein involved in Fe transport|nr:TonB-dependent receptor [Gammaproteobacteria bacterium]MDP6617422.1 TonB-dependent receptor [Gammaproteobacteria bacterium]MDP7041254.1 TonB-dependent receptor [Gammaproteobacteria bacterium]